MPSIFFPFHRILDFLRRKRTPRRVRREMANLRWRLDRAESDLILKKEELSDARQKYDELHAEAQTASICKHPAECGEIAGLNASIARLEDKHATIGNDLTRENEERRIALLRAVELETCLKTANRERDACAAAVTASSDERRAMFRRTEELCGEVDEAEKRIVAMANVLQTFEQAERTESAQTEELAKLRQENVDLRGRHAQVTQDLVNANDDIRDLRNTLQENLDHLCA